MLRLTSSRLVKELGAMNRSAAATAANQPYSLTDQDPHPDARKTQEHQSPWSWATKPVSAVTSLHAEFADPVEPLVRMNRTEIPQHRSEIDSTSGIGPDTYKERAAHHEETPLDPFDSFPRDSVLFPCHRRSIRKTELLNPVGTKVICSSCN